MELKQFEELSGTLHSMRGLLDEQKTSYSDMSVETKNQIERMNKRIDEIELAANRPSFTGGNTEQDARKSEAKALFLKTARIGYDRISTEERKIMRELEPSTEERKTYFSSDDTTGGFFAPIEIVQTLLKNIVLISPIRQEATVRPTSREAASVGRRLGTPRAAWGNEQTNLQQTQAAYGREDIPTHKLTAYSVIANQDLEDGIFPLEEQLNMDLSEEFARAEGQQFVIGTGVSPYPEGLLTNPNVAIDYSGNDGTGTGTGLTGDGLIKTCYNLKSGYTLNAKWYMNRQSIGVVRLLKDTQGRYLLQPGIAMGAPSTILDYPYVEIPDMPAVATNSFPVLFGDMRKAYMVIDRIGMSMQRLDQLFAVQDAIGFKARVRVGGQVVLPEALRKTQIHA